WEQADFGETAGRAEGAGRRSADRNRDDPVGQARLRVSHHRVPRREPNIPHLRAQVGRPGAAAGVAGDGRSVRHPTAIVHLMIELDHVSKRYGTKTAVEGLNLHIAAGEVFAFLGPNGAGKTTTIKMIFG